MRKDTTLLVGKNNTGKTSFVVLLEKFLINTDNFNYSDFPLDLRQKLHSIDNITDLEELSIRLVLKIKYSETDNIEILSEFMLDLDPTRRHVNILLECQIDKKKLLADQPTEKKARKKFIENNLTGKYLNTVIYAFDDDGYTDKRPYYLTRRSQLEEKSRESLKKLLSFQVIHARRNVASSEVGNKSGNPLAAISTDFFKEQSNAPKPENSNQVSKNNNLEEISKLLSDTDDTLDDEYQKVFGGFLIKARDFLNINELKVISNIQSQTLIENSSQVIYGDNDNFLPENYSGLGYLNILYLLLQIEMCKEKFLLQATPLKLLIIEEPEAHTHPQMQYIFADKICGIIEEIPNLQALITTHSSHIVAKSKFEDIRYLFKNDDEECISIKNFHTDLKRKYDELGASGEDLFKFLKQYLSINSAELFFAKKAIFIEGTTERMLLPWFIQKHDENIPVVFLSGGLSSQNISILEVGANAKAFAPFLEFIGIKALIITDIDSTTVETSEKSNNRVYPASPVSKSTHTSNASIKFFLSAPDIKEDEEYKSWYKNLREGKQYTTDSNLRVAYQTFENGYHARSFEDSFISLNIDILKENELSVAKTVLGLKKRDEIAADNPDIYTLTNNIIEKKSDFAASILFKALSKEVDWKIPSYIQEGLKWLHQA